ncbi:hypothetical protein [Solobacterium moorei]|uniref:hypothetical protein n=1 Tax=Solobacterium moorei TaxID=102148 RepID=UPI0028E9B8E8|nr:hypothetical protein [Solobacterium moorei]
MDLKDLMMLYGVTLGSRKTQRKKNLFVETVKDACKEMNVPIKVLQNKEGVFASTSIVIGNLETAKYVFLAGFDTPAQYLTGLKQYPFHPEKSSRAENVKNGIRFLIVALLAVCAYIPLQALVSQGVKLLSVLTLMVLLAGIVILLFPKANPYNFSRSSAVAVMMKLAESKNANTAFVMCDHTVSGYIGYRAVKNEIPENSRVILLGPMASGSRTVVVFKDRDSQFASALAEQISDDVIQRKYAKEEAERNCLSLFPHCIYIGCGDIENREFVVNNTACRKDMKVDMERLERIVNGLEREIIHE